MRKLAIIRTLARYWKMAHDPRTPKIVRYLIYAGIVTSVSPIQLAPGLGLVEDAAVLPSLIALTLILIPKGVRQDPELGAKMKIGPAATPRVLAEPMAKR